MNLAALAIDKKAVTYFIVLLLVVGGFASFRNLGQLEDPAFTVKTAVITTIYPGASPAEVELEITDRIELAVQEMSEVKYIESFSRAGQSQVKVEIQPQYWSDKLPQIWDELRRKVRDVEGSLPPGAERPAVGDDFGDVFGFQLAVTGDGYSYAEIETYAKALKKEISLIDGVARVDLWGVQNKVIYLDVSDSQLTQLGITDGDLRATLQAQNLVVDAGSVDLGEQRMRIAPTGEFKSPQDIADLVVTPSALDAVKASGGTPSSTGSSELLRVGDIGTVRRGYVEPAFTMLRYNGEPAIGLSITNQGGINVVEMGRRVDRRLEDLTGSLPVGIDLHRVHWQSDIIAEAVNGFLINFAEAVGIVLVILTLFMGWRMGVIIGTSLIVTILASFILMDIFNIDLQRMSLGALVIALGMMVDNSIVVADGIVARLQQGMDRKQAAIESALQPSWPLLGATVVAVMAFYPIFASTESAGEYCRTLFTVVAISLLVSWVVSMTLTPLQCMDMLKVSTESGDPYGGRFYRGFRGILNLALKVRFLTIGGVIGLLVVAVIGFTNVDQLFFPDSSMRKFMIDYWTPEGTRIEQVAADLGQAEDLLQKDERIASVATFIGAGPPRFYLPVDPESPYQSYAQLIVNVHDFRDIGALIDEYGEKLTALYPNALLPMRKFGVGPSYSWKFELRLSGPAEADPATLRRLSEEVQTVLAAEPKNDYTNDNWRQPVKKVVPVFNEQRARWARVERPDLAEATKRAFDGLSIGLYRENDDLIPIVVRRIEAERQNVGGIDVLPVNPAMSSDTVPLSQVTDGVNVEWENPIIWRRDRRRTITVQANPIQGQTLPTLRAAVVNDVEAIALPKNYTMEWGGEFEGTVDAQKSLIPGVIPAVGIMLVIIVALFNAFRPPLVIILTIPFAAIGISAGLLATNTPFGFLALLGAMSLAGMMIKNAIVLLDQINVELDAGKAPYEAVLEAALSRLRPVILAAATTVLGVVPLLQDVFWVGLAVTVMAGLSFGTVLTMILVPTLYATLHNIRRQAS
jgi:multidrug efflux pump subunit AcrB